MSGSTRRKLRSEIRCGPSLDDGDDGTAARTRPLSYDEIMLKRKSKKELGGPREEAGEAESTRHKESVKKPDHHSRDINLGAMRNSRDHAREASSGKKDEKTSKIEDTHRKSNNKEGHDVEGRSKHKHEKEVRNSTEALIDDKRSHGRSKLDEHSRDDFRYDYEKKHQGDSVAQDRYMDRSRGAPEREKKRKDRNGDDERYRIRDPLKKHESGNRRDPEISERKEKIDPLKKHESGNRRESEISERKEKMDPLKKHESGNRRDSDISERKEKMDILKKRESGNRRDSDISERKEKMDPLKKHDSGNRHNSDISERKEKMERSHSRHDEMKSAERSQSRHDEMKSKRRRSRSQEPIKDKGRRSSSLSPKARKNVSSHGDEHGEISLHSQRDRARHSDNDWNKMPSNGSSSHHRRHGYSSGLGGYSPRKRKTEAAVKTPSPIRSPERKSAGWDLPPSGTADKNLSSSVASGPQPFVQTKSSNMIDLAAGISVGTSMGKPLAAILSNNFSAFKQASFDSVQLTQATRPMRRLYIDNIPASVTEKDILESFNNFLLSSGVNYIRGTRPCISCMIHKEKGQALVEFLTPEDASAALSFDGRSLFGSILKIRRPKDYVEMASGSSEKSKAGVDAISDFVKDSPHKIFIGGIAEGLSSEMIMEIVSVFGPLKAYHYEINEDLDGPCAFLEYADHSVTLKACAGLNGMKLGGRVLTVTQALPNMPFVEYSRSRPFYGIPEHVKPLLQTPTPVLKLSNVLDPEGMKLLSEADLEEIVEDIRLECTRFGSVVSVNVVKTSNLHTTIPETEVRDDDDIQPFQPQVEGEPEPDDKPESNVESSVELVAVSHDDDVKEGNNQELARVEQAETELQNCDDLAEEIDGSTVEIRGRTNNSDVNLLEEPIPESAMECDPNEKMEEREKSGDGEISAAENLLDSDKAKDTVLEEVTVRNNDSENTNQKAGVTENEDDNGYVFEVGCVLVEFRRSEASCMAAHCLHGRVFDDRIVAVEYVPLEAYRSRFPK